MIRQLLAAPPHLAQLVSQFALNCARLRRLRAEIKAADPTRPLIAIMRPEHMGDIVALEPVSRYLREQNPAAYIVWCVRRPYLELVEHNPHLNGCLAVHCWTECMWLSRIGFFDQVIDLALAGNGCTECAVLGSKHVRPSEINTQNYYHLGSLLAAHARAAGLPPLNTPPSVYIPFRVAERIDALDLPADYLVLHGQSNEVARDWPAPRWQELTTRLAAAGFDLVEVGIRPVVTGIRSPRYHDRCGQLAMLETAEVIARAALFIGIDSGPAHLANAVGTPGVVLLGRYRGFDRYMPYSGGYADGSKARVLASSGVVADLTVEQVYEAVMEQLAAPPRSSQLTGLEPRNSRAPRDSGSMAC